MNDIEELIEESSLILINKRKAYESEELTEEQYIDLRNQTLLDVGYQMEIITELIMEEE